MKVGSAARNRMTGAAWLSSARAVRCSVKSRNERNPCRMLNIHLILPGLTGRKVGMTSNQHGPLTPWATHMLQWNVTKSCQVEKWS